MAAPGTKQQQELKPIFVRAKRKNQTIFLECDPYDSIEALKERLAAVVQRDPDDIRLYPCLTEERRRAIVEEKQRAAAAATVPRPATSTVGLTSPGSPAKPTSRKADDKKPGTASSKVPPTASGRPATKSGAASAKSTAGAAEEQQPAQPPQPQQPPEPEKVFIPGLEGSEEMTLPNLVTAVRMEDESFLLPIPPFDETKTPPEVGLDNDSVLFFGFRIEGDVFEQPDAEGYPNGIAPY